MFKRYPDTITITRKPEYEQDANGDYQPTGSSTIFTSECRAEPAGKKSEAKGKDGNVIEYVWDVYMPHTDEVFSFGDAVSITMPNGVSFTGTYKGQPHNQLITVIWV